MLLNQLCHAILVVPDLSNKIERERERKGKQETLLKSRRA